MSKIFSCLNIQKYERISNYNISLDISKWNIDNKKKEIIQKVYDNFAILNDNLDLPEYQKFIFDNFVELINIFCKCVIKLDLLNNKENTLFNNSKLVEYNLINTKQFIKYINYTNYTNEYYKHKIAEIIIKNIINFINFNNEKFIELWNKYETIILSKNIFICLCYNNSKIQEIITDEILKDNFESLTIKDIMSFGNKTNYLKNYLSICNKINLHQDEIYNYINDHLTYCSEEQFYLVYCCYNNNNSKFKKIFFDKLLIYHNMKVEKSNFFNYIKNQLTSDDYDEFIREYLPTIFNYKIIDDIYKKQEEIEKRLDLIIQKLNMV